MTGPKHHRVLIHKNFPQNQISGLILAQTYFAALCTCIAASLYIVKAALQL